MCATNPLRSYTPIRYVTLCRHVLVYLRGVEGQAVFGVHSAPHSMLKHLLGVCSACSNTCWDLLYMLKHLLGICSACSTTFWGLLCMFKGACQERDSHFGGRILLVLCNQCPSMFRILWVATWLRVDIGVDHNLSVTSVDVGFDPNLTQI